MGTSKDKINSILTANEKNKKKVPVLDNSKKLVREWKKTNKIKVKRDRKWKA